MKTWKEQVLPLEAYLCQVLPQSPGNFDMTMMFPMVVFFISNPISTIAADPVFRLYFILTLLWAISIVFLFIDLSVLYLPDCQCFHKQRSIPMPILWLCSIIAPISCLAALMVNIYYSLLPATMIGNEQWRIYIGGLTALCLLSHVWAVCLPIVMRLFGRNTAILRLNLSQQMESAGIYRLCLHL